MMNQRSFFSIIDWIEFDSTIIEIPLTNKNTSMYIVLPNEIGSINKIIESLKNFNDLSILFNIQRKYKQYINLSIPKFKQNNFYDLKPILKNVGLLNLFLEPNLTYISEQKLKLDLIQQKVIFEVNSFFVFFIY